MNPSLYSHIAAVISLLSIVDNTQRESGEGLAACSERFCFDAMLAPKRIEYVNACQYSLYKTKILSYTECSSENQAGAHGRRTNVWLMMRRIVRWRCDGDKDT